jgi:hypothetical protein
VPGWPPISEPELLKRLRMGDAEFAELIAAVVAQLPPRGYDAAVLEQAIGYPWARPEGSFRLAGGEVELLAALPAEERKRVIGQFSSAESGRLPLLAIGSNAAPEALERKFAHFDEEGDREVLALSGGLHDFDVGVAPQPTMYGAMPATLFSSPGTAVSATILWVTPAQFTQLAWSEITYRLGRLRARFDVDETAEGFDEVLAFISRFGAFCVDGQPVALAAIPATGRAAAALSQEQLLDAAAALAIGPEATAETLVQAIFEDIGQLAPRIAATLHKESQPFASAGWIPFGLEREEGSRAD